MEEISFDVNGLTFKALASGPVDAPVILALHGWLDNAATFNELRPYFSEFRFIALDVAGHGRSDYRPDSMPYYIWDNVTDVLEVVEQISNEPLILMGHSMGASIASLFTASFADKVSQLILIEGLAPLVYEEEHLPELMADAIIKRKKMKQKSLRPYPSVEAAMEVRINGRWPVNAQGARWLVERGTTVAEDGVIWSSDPGVMLPSLLRMSETQVRSYMSSIQVPVTLYLGDQGLYEPFWQDRMDLIENLSVVTFKGNHHLHLYPEPARKIAEDIIPRILKK